MAETEMDPAYREWPKHRRFDAALHAHVVEGMSQVKAAKKFGVSRAQLHTKIAAYKEAHAEKIAEAKRKIDEQGPAAGSTLRVGNERRRVPETFQEFDDYYFGHFTCPDCVDEHGENVPHARKPFHDEIVNAIFGEHKRVVINVPPFHAKSTYGTVRSTVYAIVRNPNIRRLIVSKSQTFAKTFMHSIQELLTNPDLYPDSRNLVYDFGPFKPERAQSMWNASGIYVAGRTSQEKDPTVQVLGVGGQIYGRRADEIIADDVCTLENQRNP
ncbi:MAG TPA: helix-turn-helix domain-containing protein, partial [Acidimicrobiales bacterium]|nr:helix-turn-helix domain-containing protein [Acidimicrobiales bacterium]